MEQTTQSTPLTQPTQPTAALMTTLMALIDNYIRDIVTSQVNDILTNHRTMRVIDDAFKEQVTDIAQIVVENAISQHNDDEYHISEDAINDIATSVVEDHDFDNQISQAVNDALLEHDFEQEVRDALSSITFSVTVD